MPDLSFKIEGVEPAERSLTPLLRFRLGVTNTPAAEQIRGGMIHAQIQLQPAQRRYTPGEQARLVELFGPPARWDQTVRHRLWSHVDATVLPFTGETETALWVPCTFDLNITATKYFYALEDGDVPLRLFFSGVVFFTSPDGSLQVQRIGGEKECAFAFPVRRWHELMEWHYPNSAWISLRRDAFDRLSRFKRERGIPTWEEMIERLMAATEQKGEVVT